MRTLSFATLLLASSLLPAFPAAPVRENIEWLDVWLPHSNDHALPRVLLIGDSITRSYGKAVETLLEGKAYVSRVATSKSLGDPALLDQVELVLKEQQFDYIHFNNGLHGDGYTEAQYAAALPELIALLHRLAPRAKLIWAASTDVRIPKQLDQIGPKNARIIERNRLAAQVAKAQNIPIDDLYALIHDYPGYHAVDGIHFNEQGVKVLAAQVAAEITKLLVPKP